MTTAVWYQPSSSFAKWILRRITTLFGFENEGDTSPAKMDSWCKAAQDAGLKYVLQDSAAAHWTDPNCVGVFLTPDEPNGANPRTPAQTQAAAMLLRQRTSKPLWLSLNGGALLTQSDVDVAGWCAAADVLTWFSYPANYGKMPGGMAEVSAVADKLKRLAPTKQIMLITECSNQGIGKQPWTLQNDATGTPLSPKMRGPTGDEMSAMIGMALGRGVSGIVYFPDIINLGFGGFDGTTPDCEAAMRSINAAITQPPVIAAQSTTVLQFDSLTLNGVKYVPAK